MHVNYTKLTAVFSFKAFSISYVATVVNKSLDNIHHLRSKNQKVCEVRSASVFRKNGEREETTLVSP
jgi:hypothetical protein